MIPPNAKAAKFRTIKAQGLINDTCTLKELLHQINEGCDPWVEENTALIVFHGIGNQLPIETLDQFGRGLINEFQDAFNCTLHLEHKLMCKEEGRDVWFDNVLRLTKKGERTHIDLYEYYWANYSEDKANWGDINTWLQGVVDNSEKFYQRKREMGEQNGDKSIFFKKGKFNYSRYKFLLVTVSKVYFIIDSIIKAFLLLLTYLPLPYVGGWAKTLLQKYISQGTHKLSNVLGDIVVYNVTDPKCKFYVHRRQIMDGGVNALRYLFEKQQADGAFAYPSIIVAGHSLGSQIAYDAINRVNLLINTGQLQAYGCDGKCIIPDIQEHTIAGRLKGFITFGSPLDKIAFFIRENVEDSHYIRQQILEYYHSFKAKTFVGNEALNHSITQSIKPLFDEVPWKNYYDDADYVSGSLDYYTNVTNINCGFEKSRFFHFTHSEYWTCKGFYADIIHTFLNTSKQDSPETIITDELLMPG